MTTPDNTSTIALSVHNAIVAMDRPSAIQDIALFLRIYHEQVTDEEVEKAVTCLIARGHVACASGPLGRTFVDTKLRDQEGKRRMIRDRPRALDGWF